MISKLVRFARVRSWRLCGTCLVLWLCAIWLSVSLFTYHQTDRSFLYEESDSFVVANKAGALGAHGAALLYFLFGTAAIFLIPFLFFIGSTLLVQGTLRRNYDQVVGWILMIASASVLGAWYSVPIMKLGCLPGGACGASIVHACAPIDQLIVGLCVHAVFFISLILISRGAIMRIVHLMLCQKISFFTHPVKKIYCHLIKISWTTLTWCYTLPQRFVAWIVPSEQIVMPEYRITKVAINHDKLWSEPNSSKMNASAVFHAHTVKQSVVEPIAQSEYKLPPLSLFCCHEMSKEELHQTKRHEQLAAILEEKLLRFGIQGKVVSIKAGPVVTLFEYQPHIDAKVSKILALEDDLALALQAIAIRIIAPIPGRSVVGFEVANQIRLPVYFSDIINSIDWQKTTAHLPLVLGVDTSGTKIIVDLATMPHLLIAGATGSGKSVALNAMLVSLLCKKTPEDLKLILIDPKRLEFATYAAIPHLLFPIVDDAKQASNALRWVVQEMDRRYQQLAAAGVRHIYDYQNRCTTEQHLEKLPLIVVIIDELSDLMMVAGKDVEMRIARLAQMARAAGIHLIVATQRPSVDVITGIIKVNFPSRIAFKVASKIDSRIILDCAGADKLVGKGDMLYLDGGSTLMRVHGAFITDLERHAVAEHVRTQQAVEYLDTQAPFSLEGDDDIDENDQELYQEVLSFIKLRDEISISLLQRQFRIGYNRSARMIEKLEASGLIISTEGGKTRKVIR
jgi:S-DNA-T family DNA segregation ATPase FtsK/SpoIIIE